MKKTTVGPAVRAATSAPTGVNQDERLDEPLDEPLGIVISRGTREEPIPTVIAYIWGPAPGPTDESSRAA